MAKMQDNDSVNSLIAPIPSKPPTTLSLQNHRLLYIHPSSHFSGLTKSLKIFSIPSLAFPINATLTRTATKKAKTLIASATPSFILKRENFPGSQMVYSDSSSEIIAEWAVPLLSFGASEIIFPYESPYSSHAIMIEPLGAVKRGVRFVKDSIVFEWNVEKKDDPAVFVLRKGVGGEKVVVGEFVGEGHQAGMVVVDEAEVDAFVAVAGVIAILQRSDSFVK